MRAPDRALTCSLLNLRGLMAIHSCCIMSGDCCSCVIIERTSCWSLLQRGEIAAVSACTRCCTAWRSNGSCSSVHENGRQRGAPFALACRLTKRNAHSTKRGGALITVDGR